MRKLELRDLPRDIQNSQDVFKNYLEAVCQNKNLDQNDAKFTKFIQAYKRELKNGADLKIVIYPDPLKGGFRFGFYDDTLGFSGFSNGGVGRAAEAVKQRLISGLKNEVDTFYNDLIDGIDGIEGIERIEEDEKFRIISSMMGESNKSIDHFNLDKLIGFQGEGKSISCERFVSKYVEVQQRQAFDNTQKLHDYFEGLTNPFFDYTGESKSVRELAYRLASRAMLLYKSDQTCLNKLYNRDVFKAVIRAYFRSDLAVLRPNDLIVSSPNDLIVSSPNGSMPHGRALARLFNRLLEISKVCARKGITSGKLPEKCGLSNNKTPVTCVELNKIFDRSLENNDVRRKWFRRKK